MTRKDPRAMKWVMVTRSHCARCEAARETLRQYGIDFVDFNIVENHHLADFLSLSGLTTLPQVFADGHLIGGPAETRDTLMLTTSFP